MSVSLSLLPDFVYDLFVNLPHQLNGESDNPFCRRQRPTDPSSFVSTLVLGWLSDPNASVADLAEFATEALDKPISASALRQRFTPAAVELLQGVLQHALEPLIEGRRANLDLLSRFSAVGLHDSTLIRLPDHLANVWPGCGNQTARLNAGCKLLLGFELSRGGLFLLDFFPARVGDQRLTPHCRGLPEGSLLLRDLGFFSLAEMDQQAQSGCYYLSRAHPQLVIRPQGGAGPVSLAEFLRGKGFEVDEWVQAGARWRVRCRLVAWRVPEEVAEQRRQKRLEWQKRKKRRRDRKKGKGKKAAKGKGQSRKKKEKEEQLELCGWVVTLSNVPAEKMSVKETEALLRARWQIELVIKVWKGTGCLEQLRGTRRERIECELLAKLLGQLLSHWAILSSGLVYLRANVTAAAKRVQKSAPRLAEELVRGQRPFRRQWRKLQRRLARVGQRRRGNKRPSTYQRLGGCLPSPWWVLS